MRTGGVSQRPPVKRTTIEENTIEPPMAVKNVSGLDNLVWNRRSKNKSFGSGLLNSSLVVQRNAPLPHPPQKKEPSSKAQLIITAGCQVLAGSQERMRRLRKRSSTSVKTGAPKAVRRSVRGDGGRGAEGPPCTRTPFVTRDEV